MENRNKEKHKMEDKVLAKIGDEEIKQSDFQTFLQNVPKEQQAYLSNPQARYYYFDQMVAVSLFAKEAEDAHMDETEEAQIAMRLAKKDILAQLGMREALKNVKVTEEEMKAFYEQNHAQFTKGETAHAKHILVDSEETCQKILEEIKSGAKSFEDAATEYSSCPSGQRGGDLGDFGRGQMVKEFDEAAFGGPVGEILGPVKTQFGYHLILVENRTEATEASFEEVEETIRRNLLKQKQNQVYSAKVDELRARYHVWQEEEV